MLLDTHVVIWAALKPEQLSVAAREALLGADERWVSVASAWEYEAKRVRSPDILTKPFDALLVEEYRRLDVRFGLHNRLAQLPPFHSDPFDRTLIAQALDLGLTLVTADKAIHRYPVPTLW